MSHTTTVFYALGGGRGHATRAFELAKRVGGRSVVFHQAPGDWPEGSLNVGRIGVAELRARLAEALRDASRFVVDTFPGGIAHELDVSGLVQRPGAAPVPTVLVARYVDREAYAGYDALVARFDEVWLPYDADGSEWDDPPSGTWIGPVVRDVRLEGEVDTLVIGADAPASWEPLLRGATRVDGLFGVLPRARRVVALAAGYNLGWELRRTGARVAFRPLSRRFDDQFRRAARLGVPLYHRADLEGFLAC
ncbi:MAG: hypothetical protein H6737_21895 [Alphaproteobacteria bacterium]|nr:hypothetical protein [Alphaproteobacteria bacterium]